MGLQDSLGRFYVVLVTLSFLDICKDEVDINAGARGCHLPGGFNEIISPSRILWGAQWG